MSENEMRTLQWWELPAEYWLRRVECPVTPEALAEVPWPIEESAIRQEAKRQGMVLERIDADRYRLWDFDTHWLAQMPPTPVDLTAEGEYVDSLPGIAIFLSYSE